MPIGDTTLYQGGRGLGIARTTPVEYVFGGTTVDWTSVPAASGSDTTLPDGQVIPAGVQYVRYGTVMCLLTSGSNKDKIAPYNSGGSAGEEALTPGYCGLLEYTVRKDQLHADNPGLIDGGNVYPERVTDVTGNPPINDLIAAFPRISFRPTNPNA